jgi:hypothetical protein
MSCQRHGLKWLLALGFGHLSLSLLGVLFSWSDLDLGLLRDDGILSNPNLHIGLVLGGTVEHCGNRLRSLTGQRDTGYGHRFLFPTILGKSRHTKR